MSDAIFKKTGFPEEKELVICTVTKIYPNSVFVNMDDYNKGGMIHISEVSPGRIRNIRDYIRESKVIVCKVLRVNQERGHVDLSLRRVSDNERRNFTDSRKQEQKANKILEYTAQKLKIPKSQLEETFAKSLVEKYGTLNSAFEAVVLEGLDLKKEGVDASVAEVLSEVIHQRIKPPKVTIGGEMNISSYLPDGVDVIKKALIDATKKEHELMLNYLGGGRYQIELSDSEYKTAEQRLDKVIKSVQKALDMEENTFSFHRIEKSK